MRIGLGLPGVRPVFAKRSTLHLKQISPDKDMNFHSTTASFTVSTEPWASLSCANLPMDSALYDVSVRRLTVLLQASFPQSLAALQLPFANSCCTLNKYRSSPIRDLHPISSCPCRAYTKKSSRRKKRAAYFRVIWQSCSDCLKSQAFSMRFGCQYCSFLSIAFMIHSSFLMEAVSATILHLP